MASSYVCELCKKVFAQKIDYTRHTKKKAPCISVDKIQELVKTSDIRGDNRGKLANIFNYCLDVLRNNEHLTGDKALRTLAHLLDLKLLEPQFGCGIDIDGHDYEFHKNYEDSAIEEHKAKLLKFVRFSNLAKEPADNIPNIMEKLWNDILAVHPITKNIFLAGRGFDINNQSTFKKIIDKLASFDFAGIEEDILGEAYEEVIKDVMTGKVLGQFFTPPKVKKLMIITLDPQLKADGTTETIFDPAMGTGGFLISCLRHILKQSKTRNIPINWEFVSNGGLGGREAEPDTYQLAISNMLISSGRMFSSLERGDSIRNPIIKKYDCIIANPPFGIDGLIYVEILHVLRNQYMPIKSNSAVPLFLQAIIYMLNINGRCAVVLPEGQELFSKNKELVAVREYLMKTCELKEIIYLPAGTFTHTTIKTCIFYFHKKKEGSDILETKVKYSKTTQKETERSYIFTKTHQTHKVKFYDYNTETEEKHLLVEAEIDAIASKNYSLNYTEYLVDKSSEEIYEDGIVVKTLGEVCCVDYGTRIVKGNNTEGEYPVYGSGRAMFSTTTFNREGYNILIGRFALSLECVRFITDTIFLNDSGLSVKPKDTKILLHKYVGYYLYENQNIIYECARGTAQKNLDMDKFRAIKIPIPSLERQNEIVKYLDFIYDKCIKTSTEKILELKQLNEYCLSTQKIFGENIMKTLGEVCKFLPKSKRQASFGQLSGKYPFFKSSLNVSHYVDNPDYTEESLIIGDGGEPNINYGIKFSTSDHCYILQNKIKDCIILKYVYYYYYNNLDMMKHLYTGVAIKNISKLNIESIKIPIPSLERQKEIVDYCEFNDSLIKQLEKEIEQNKKQAKLFISGIIKTLPNETEPISQPEDEGTSQELDVSQEPQAPTKTIEEVIEPQEPQTPTETIEEVIEPQEPQTPTETIEEVIEPQEPQEPREPKKSSKSKKPTITMTIEELEHIKVIFEDGTTISAHIPEASKIILKKLKSDKAEIEHDGVSYGKIKKVASVIPSDSSDPVGSEELVAIIERAKAC